MKKKWISKIAAMAAIGVVTISGSTWAAEEKNSMMTFRPYSDAEYARINGLEYETEEEIQEETEETEVSYIIFVGDSRIVGMASNIGGYYYIAKTAQGYDWLVNTALAQTESAMAEYPNAAVVFCLGVNDLGNIDNYISCYQDLIDRYPDRSIYFLSVMPVDDEQAQQKGYLVENDEIAAFNDALEAAFPDQYLDIYYYMQVNGFAATDGVHYDGGTYAMIQDYVQYMVLK